MNVLRRQGAPDQLPAVIDERLAPFSERLDQLAAAIEKTAAWIAVANSDFGELVGRVDELELVLEVRSAESGEMSAGLRFAMNKVDTRLTHDVIGLDVRLEDLAETVHELIRRPALSALPFPAAAAAAGEPIETETARAFEARLEQAEEQLRSALTVLSELAPGVRETLEERVGALSGRLERVERREGAIAWKAELVALEERLRSEPGASAADVENAVAALEEMRGRVARLERDRDDAVAEAARLASKWASERAAIQERVGELAARVVPSSPRASRTQQLQPSPRTQDGWSMLERDVDIVRIGMEGLRMRLAAFERANQQLSGTRQVSDRIEEIAERMARLEVSLTRDDGVGEDALDRLERLARRMDDRLERIEHA
ncbi:MAG: hypothetical protein ACKVUT_16830 [Gaiella sp.]